MRQGILALVVLVAAVASARPGDDPFSPELTRDDELAIMASDPELADAARLLAAQRVEAQPDNMRFRAPVPEPLPTPPGALNEKGEQQPQEKPRHPGLLGVSVAVFNDEKCKRATELAAHPHGKDECFEVTTSTGAFSVRIDCYEQTARSPWQADVYQSTDCSGPVIAKSAGHHSDDCEPLSKASKMSLKVRCDRAIIAGREHGKLAHRSYKEGWKAKNAGTKAERTAKEKARKRAAALERLHKRASEYQKHIEEKRAKAKEKLSKAAAAYQKHVQRTVLKRLVKTYQGHLEAAQKNISHAKNMLVDAHEARNEAMKRANTTNWEAERAFHRLKVVHARLEVLRLRMQADGIKQLREHVKRALNLHLPANATSLERQMVDTVRHKLRKANDEMGIVLKYVLMIISRLESHDVVVIPSQKDITSLNKDLVGLQVTMAAAVNRSSAFDTAIATHKKLLVHHQLLINDYTQVIARSHRIVARLKYLIGETKIEIAKPICEPDCVNGKCVANDTCQCNAGFIGKRCSIEVASIHHFSLDVNVSVVHRQYEEPEVTASANATCTRGKGGPPCQAQPTKDVHTYVKVLPAPLPPPGPVPYDDASRYGIKKPVVVPVGNPPKGATIYDGVSDYWPTAKAAQQSLPAQNSTSANTNTSTWNIWEKQAGVVDENEDHVPTTNAPKPMVVAQGVLQPNTPTSTSATTVMAPTETAAATTTMAPVKGDVVEPCQGPCESDSATVTFDAAPQQTPPPCAECCSHEGRVFVHARHAPHIHHHPAIPKCQTSAWTGHEQKLEVAEKKKEQEEEEQQQEKELKHQTFVSWESGDGANTALLDHVCEHASCCAHPNTGILHVDGRPTHLHAPQTNTRVCADHEVSSQAEKEEAEDEPAEGEPKSEDDEITAIDGLEEPQPHDSPSLRKRRELLRRALSGLEQAKALGADQSVEHFRRLALEQAAAIKEITTTE